MSQGLEILTNASGIGPSTLEDFKNAGFESIKEVGRQTPEELEDQVNGVGYSTAISVLKYLEKEGHRYTSNRDDDLERLVELLRDLFEFNNKDRKFGIYKLMNANRDKINKYIKEDLIDKIETEVEYLHERFSGKSRDEVKEEVIESLGAEALEGDSLSDKALSEIQERTDGVSEEDLENVRSEIYNHIYQFFSNYYESGDFITQRKRTNRSEPYSIPYDGSNTNFHWATKDQYYAKTSEQFTRFTFNLNGYKICFKTFEDEIEGSGVGNSKYLVMGAESDIKIKENSVIIPFYHRMIDDDDLERFDISSSTHNKQSTMNNKFSNILKEYLDDKDISVSRELFSEKIDEYTTRNQNDFFIHKNIEKFLTEELEEYVKSEVFTYDPDTGVDSVSDLSMEKGRIINDIVKDIISFVSQLEEFKRKVFEKKKFVKNSEKLVQLKNIPEENYENIIENGKQLTEWNESLDVDTSDLTVSKLSKFPYNQMMVDTKYFSKDITSGREPHNKLIKSDNYQALNLLKEKYKNGVKCIQIDPPYNTGNADFAYKDNYQRSTWLSIMNDRFKLAKKLLSNNGVLFVNIDENEIKNTIELLNNIFGEENHVTTFIWNNRTTVNESNTNVSTNHEYIVCYSKNINNVEFMGQEKEFNGYKNPDNDERGEWRSMDLQRENKGNDSLVYPIEDPESGRSFRPQEGRRWTHSKENMKELIEDNRVWFPDDDDGVPRKKGFKSEADKYKPLGSILDTDIVGRTYTGTNELKKVFGRRAYDYPKPPSLIKRLIEQVTDNGDTVLDFFAGSGTTVQAVHELNRERDEKVNYIMVEMLNKAFDITKERTKRTAYAEDWKDGKPQSTEKKNKNMDLEEFSDDEDKLDFDAEYIELESYEEALDAVQFEDTQKTINKFNKTTLNYLFEFGTDEEPVFLESDQLSNPLDYKLAGNVESEDIDIMTTFNYLIGLEDWVKSNKSIEDITYTIYKGKVDSEEVLIVWRHNTNNISHEKEKNMLDCKKYGKVYINGDSSIKDSQSISAVFKRKIMSNKGDML